MGKIKNLSLRKTIVLYMIISLIISFYLYDADLEEEADVNEEGNEDYFAGL